MNQSRFIDTINAGSGFNVNQNNSTNLQTNYLPFTSFSPQ